MSIQNLKPQYISEMKYISENGIHWKAVTMSKVSKSLLKCESIKILMDIPRNLGNENVTFVYIINAEYSDIWKSNKVYKAISDSLNNKISCCTVLNRRLNCLSFIIKLCTRKRQHIRKLCTEKHSVVQIFILIMCINLVQ